VRSRPASDEDLKNIHHCIIVKSGSINKQQALSNSSTRKGDQKVLKELFGTMVQPGSSLYGLTPKVF
jgi:hypothetical protein